MLEVFKRRYNLRKMSDACYLKGVLHESTYFTKNLLEINPLKTSPEYTRAAVYGKCML